MAFNKILIFSNQRTHSSSCATGNTSVLSLLFLLLVINCAGRAVQNSSLLFPEDSSEDETSTPTTMKICAKGTRFHNSTAKCWKTKQQGPCAPTLLFYAQDKRFGDCDCPVDNAGHQTVWVYNLTLDKCFKSYEQAYCQSGDWLIFDDEGEPTCVLNKCEHLQKKNATENETFPIVLFKGKCVRLSKHSDAGNCEVLISPESGKPSCSSPTASYGIGTTSTFKCRPGTRRDRLGKCRPVNSKVTFRPSS